MERGATAYVVWQDVSLDRPLFAALEEMCSRLIFLGRAESLVEARLLHVLPADVEVNCLPVNDPAGEGISTLCPDPSRPEPRLLLQETGKLQAAGCIDPEGACWIPFKMPEFPLPLPAGSSKPGDLRARAVRFRLAGIVLPPTKLVVSVAEAMRRQTFGRLKSAGIRSRALSGHDSQGTSLAHPDGRHLHAYWLPSDEDRDGTLDHIVVAAAAGLDAAEIDALCGVESLYWGGGDYPAKLLLEELVAEWTEEQLAQRWQSITPYVPLRHNRRRSGKVRPRESAEKQCRRDLARAWGVNPETVSIEPTVGSSERLVRVRIPGGKGDYRTGYYLEASCSVGQLAAFPVAVGHSAHFGLGQFGPMS